MADIADIGFRADTSDLADAKVKLEALVPAAKKAENASKALSSAKVKEAAAAKASTAAVLAAAKASDTASKEDLKAAASADRKAAAVLAAAKADYAVVAASNAASAAMGKQGAEADRAAYKVRNLAMAANDTGMKMGAARANVGNLAAQFQDIGVTAAMGMSPLMIALQQGTQISAVLGPMGLGASIKFLGQAFLSIISPMSLLTLGLVGLAAAGFQMIDWAGLAAGALNFLADILPTVAQAATFAAIAMGLLFAPAIIAGIASLPALLYAAYDAVMVFAAGLYFTVGVPALIVAGLAAVVAAAFIFRDELTKILGFDIIKAAKDGINFIIGGFVGGYNAVKKTWSMLPAAIGDAAIGAANRAITAIAKMVNKAIEGINSLITMLPDWLGGSSGGITFRMGEGDTFANPYAGSAAKVGGIAAGEIKAAQNTDYIGGIAQYVGDLASNAANYLRDLASGLTAGEAGKDKKGGAGNTASAAKPGKTDAEKFSDIEKDAQARIRTMLVEQQQLGMTAEAAAKLKYENELLNQASQKNITLTTDQIKTIDRLAQTMAELEIQTANLKGFKEITEGIVENKLALEQERQELYMTKNELIAYRIEQDLLAQARQKNIILTDQQKLKLREEAQALAASRIEIDNVKAAFDEARGSTRNFLGDLKSNIMNGKSLLSSFADAVTNLLNRLIDKMLDFATTQLVPQNGSGGILGFFKNVLGLFSAASGVPATPQGAGIGINGNDLRGFAKGGAFTNGIYTQPTVFQFAKGSQFGEMGEAGPEAVMPLRRGPDGSLGVQMYGNQGGQGAQVVKILVQANDYFDARVDERASSVAAPMAVQAAVGGAEMAEQRIGKKRRNQIP